MPLVVASSDPETASEMRNAFISQVLAADPARDSVVGGTVRATSLEEVLRVLGGSTEVSDDTRELGVVLVADGGLARIAHYVRPVERDAAGHLQRRPPAVLAAWDDQAGRLDHFHWAFSDELATRAGLTRDEFEDLLQARRRSLAGPGAAGLAPNARN